MAEACCSAGKSLGMVQEDLLPYLGQTLIYLRHSVLTANNQLKLAYFFTFVKEPAALAQLCLFKEGSTEPEEVLQVVILIHFSSLHPSPLDFYFYFLKTLFISSCLLLFGTLGMFSGYFLADRYSNLTVHLLL